MVVNISGQETAAKPVAGLDIVTEDQHLSCPEPVCQLFAYTDSIVSDTKMSIYHMGTNSFHLSCKNAQDKDD